MPSSGRQVFTVAEDGGLLRLTPRAVTFGEDTVSKYTLSPRAAEAGGAAASAVINRRYETRYDVGDGMVWRSVVETTSEMRDGADGAEIEHSHKMRVLEACVAEGSAELDDDDALSVFWEREWEGAAPSQAAAKAGAEPARALL
jgi:hypothetical protein